MLRAGVIEASTSPWLSPVVLVKKKGGALRFCVDYRGLNAVTKGDSYPLPRIDELLDELGPKSIFTTLDARAAYWSVEVEPLDRPKTAFSDGSNFAQHLKDLEETLQLLSKAGLKLECPQKCQFAATTIDFLTYRYHRKECHQISEKFDVPRCYRVCSFRKHIPGYATLASPLHLLLKKHQTWSWGPEQQAAFETLKEKLTSAPVLRQPDFSKEFELHTDASKIALGACLMQRDGTETLHAVAYYSVLADAETRYPVIDMEALAGAGRESYLLPARCTTKSEEFCHESSTLLPLASSSGHTSNIPKCQVDSKAPMDIMDFGPSVPVRWALTILDQHSRYIQIVPLRKITGNVHRHSLIIKVIFKPIERIQTDNGQMECGNEPIVVKLLSPLLESRPRAWYQFIPELRLQINSALQKANRVSNLCICSLADMQPPIGLTNEAVFAENINLQERLQEARRAAVEASKEARSTYGAYYDRDKKIDFQPVEGSIVWYFEHRHHMGGLPPFAGKWRGPARINKLLGSSVL
ncbi:uncharacterized protein LOC122246655 [Penaeus japonicus]|uniref:uncharacterized protein LOC122246655 n=1 Tax=Penaeus japonicus TaxID=27405 RepID=UPI001C713E01|nr:uncharacterized protein LOC122246655 [Penaeus japonicus]